MPDQSVFQRRHFEQLKLAQRQLHDLLPLIDKADKCGIECAEFRQIGQELGRRLETIESEFMSPPPTR